MARSGMASALYSTQHPIRSRNHHWPLDPPTFWTLPLNTIFERSKEYLIAFVAIAFISILSRRLKRLVVEELNA
jgi:hypothetical protein